MTVGQLIIIILCTVLYVIVWLADWRLAIFITIIVGTVMAATVFKDVPL